LCALVSVLQQLLWAGQILSRFSHPGLDSFWHLYPREQVRRSTLGCACTLDGCRFGFLCPYHSFCLPHSTDFVPAWIFTISVFVCVFWSPREGLRPLLILFHRRHSDFGPECAVLHLSFQDARPDFLSYGFSSTDWDFSACEILLSAVFILCTGAEPASDLGRAGAVAAQCHSKSVRKMFFFAAASFDVCLLILVFVLGKIIVGRKPV
jgi:hypothetical protein